jgi:hypothetical protein
MPELPDFRPSVAQCPTCEGQPVPDPLARDKDNRVCNTCCGVGTVNLDTACYHCGRSVQKEYKGYWICLMDLCHNAIDELVKQPSQHTLISEGFNMMSGSYD